MPMGNANFEIVPIRAAVIMKVSSKINRIWQETACAFCVERCAMQKPDRTGSPG
jgi:hypothetical protein